MDRIFIFTLVFASIFSSAAEADLIILESTSESATDVDQHDASENSETEILELMDQESRSDELSRLARSSTLESNFIADPSQTELANWERWETTASSPTTNYDSIVGAVADVDSDQSKSWGDGTLMSSSLSLSHQTAPLWREDIPINLSVTR